MPATKEQPAAVEPNEVTKLPDEITRLGNLTREPELRFGKEKGTPFCRFGLAVETPVTPGDWSGERRTTFYEVSCFGTLAEHVAESVNKGSRVIVKGRPELDHWEDGEGKQRTTKRIVADAIGTDLRWATVIVTKSFRRKEAGGSNQSAHDEEEF